MTVSVDVRLQPQGWQGSEDAMTTLSQEQVAKFWDDGYVIIPKLFSESEIEALHQEIVRLRNDPMNYASSPNSNAVYFHGTLSNYQGLARAVFDDRLVAIAKEVLGDQIAYFGDSNFQMGRGSRRFHRDSIDRTNIFGPDWAGRYPLIRFGIYLGDFARQSGGLKIVPRSHRLKVAKLREPLRRLLKGYTRFLSYPLSRWLDISSFLRPGRVLPLRPGDVVLWHFRLLHSGNAVRLKWLPNLSLPTWLEHRIPASWSMPGGDTRTAIFISYGLPGTDLERYLQTRKITDTAAWKLCRWDSQLESEARAKGIIPIKPSAEYGSALQQHPTVH